MRKVILYGIFWFCFGPLQAQNKADLGELFHELMFGNKPLKTGNLHGHSHNDYKQDIPFLSAYYSGMESIEADVFLKDGELYVAHEESEITANRTLTSLYLEPLYARFVANGYRPFADSTKKLQLVIDIKENYQVVIPALIRQLKPYMEMIDGKKQQQVVRIVLSGDMPKPDHYQDYPDFISFDGRPGVFYRPDQLKRIAMISNSMDAYTHWNGKGILPETDRKEMEAVVQAAKQMGKPFRFWATPDSKNTWIVLEKLGVIWINTDHPLLLNEWLTHLPYNRFRLTTPLSIYQPTYASDGKNRVAKNVILLIGDGMGSGQVKAALSVNHGQLNLSQMRYMGFSRTESANAGNTDSGAGASAIATGQSTNNESISVDTAGKPLLRLTDILAKKGKKNGLLSTGDLTDATPAAFYAANIDRSASEAIAQDLLQSPIAFIGGTQPGFFHDSQKRRSYFQQLRAKGFSVLEDVMQINTQKKIALFLPDSVTRPVKEGRGNVLQRMVSESIVRLKSPNGFFLMAEGAQIDYGGHANDLPYVITETLDFDQAVGEALRFADQDGNTLVIVTADHETGGLSLLDVDEQQGYVEGNFSTNDHTNLMVPVLAYGPGAEKFIGIYKNTALFDKILTAVGVKDE
ncbi:hypothetical protein GCM10023231_01710 [Olivibacter ginsenosidimutans]|uniref:Alkaline phosphatase n=1 Tax=Olivibacter ginsenosidimutans TaxID=1176537 RepID=A0ABP9AD03_9SPHI